MAEDRYPPIRDYALISDSHSAGLVSTRASVDWGCFRRFDAPSSFARILDWDKGGFCILRPVDGEPAGRRYRGETMVLETDQRTAAGLGRTLDLFAMHEDADPHGRGGTHTPEHLLIRTAESVEGTTEWEFVCAPRFEYGIVHPEAVCSEERKGTLTGGASALTVDASVPLEPGDGEIRARFTLEEGETAWFALKWHRPSRTDRPEIDGAGIEERVRRTTDYWQEWARVCDYEGPHRDDVIRSIMVLKALTNEPTGAIVAAATTSLPERVGGERNWDYRYCWVRDATFTLYAGFILGYTSEARDFIDWLVRTTAGRAEDLQVLYGVGGERLLPEHDLDHLEGYRGSAPVRIGNDATRQFQLDLYGEILDSAHLWRKYGGEIDGELWHFLRGCVEQIAERWEEPDAGPWEVRGDSQHFVYSKAMCWVGLDRGIKAVEDLGVEGPVEEWRALRDKVRDDIMENGYDEELGSFVRAYGTKDVDASSLLLPLVGFIAPDDERMVSTVDVIRRELGRGDGLLHRYRTDDGLEGDEGAFTICSFWLVDNLAMQGRMDEAQELFDRLCALSNDVQLYSEEIEPDSGEFLGNFPQAFTHLALVNAAINIQRRPSPEEGDRPHAEAVEEKGATTDGGPPRDRSEDE